MDTKWNNTEGKKGAAFRAVVAALAFFLGVTLVLSSLGTAASRWASSQDIEDWWKSDWRDTSAFREAVADYVDIFLSLGAGDELEFAYYYSFAVSEQTGADSHAVEYTDETPLVFGSTAATEFTVIDSTGAATVKPVPEYSEDPVALAEALMEENPDAPFERDMNVLYCITVDGKVKYASDALDGAALDEAPEGYGFFLCFADGKVAIEKDGVELDVYGNGIYDSESLWDVPGYENYTAGEKLDGVAFTMAVRDTTYRLTQTSWSSSDVYHSDAMYWIQTDMSLSCGIWRSLAVTFAAGLALCALWIVLRNWRKAADRAVARVTAHIWTEARVIVTAILAIVVLLFPIAYLVDNWHNITGNTLANSGYVFRFLPYLLRAAGYFFYIAPAFLALFWCVWLWQNDRRYTPKAERRSLIRTLRMAELKYPVQLRMNRLANRRLWLPIAIFAVGGIVTLFFYGQWMGAIAYVVLWALIAMILLALAIHWLRRDRALTRDIGLLADRIQAVQSGNLSDKPTLPADSDLHDMAERLGNIQDGLKTALREQMRSERLKVELVSNVSHDLKTPLTSILSYSELLLQEELNPTAHDYALILAQKAQRLNAMVQDVFEVSKAASDQLPVSLERLDLAKLLRQTLADMDEAIGQSGLVFKLDLPDEPVEIIADGKRLYRVFQNLIQNALRYSLAGSRVYLTLKTDTSRAEATLRNTSQSELPNIDFTARFVRGDESRTDGGSGLGLSIAKSFTEACGGAFHIETLADLFTAIVTFPLAEK